ncbi:MAG: hypothetical protein FWC87_03265 [Acidimicrobiaceae bacterium]|nr:hypothetical protein [Acidimicrobiaceae bacterium]
MTDPAAGPTAGPPVAPEDEPAAYFRGASVAFDRRQAIRVAVGFWLSILVVLLVVLSVTAIGDMSRRSRLEHRGTPVTVTVTSCLSVASGTGETVLGASCRGTYTLAGTTHEGLVHGMPGTLPAGTTVAALVDPAHPSTLSTARSVASGRSSWGAFVPAGVTALILALSLAAVFGRARRSARHGRLLAAVG